MMNSTISKENITYRNRERRRASSVGNLTDASIESILRMSLSHHDLNESGDSDYDSKQKIKDLEIKILSADSEIDRLLQENSTLQKQIGMKNKVIEAYKKIELSEISVSTPLAGRKRKRRRLPGDALDSSTHSNFSVPTRDGLVQQVKELEEKVLDLNKWLEEEKKKSTDLRAKLQATTQSIKPITKVTELKKKLFYQKKIKKLMKRAEFLEKKCQRLNLQQRKTNLKFQHGKKMALLAAEVSNQNISDNILTSQIQNKTECVILSDELGRGMTDILTKRYDIPKNFMNYCKPRATTERILENFEGKTKHLNTGDTIVIIISNFLDNYLRQNAYLKQLKGIVENKNRKYNVILTGFCYDGWNDRQIFTVNNEIASLANFNENVKYLDLNINGNYSQRKRMYFVKELITQQIRSVLLNNFRPSSVLTFIKQSDTNEYSKTTFQKTLQSLNQR